MLKAMIEKIEKMAGPKVYDIGNEHYASANLVRIDPKKDFPKSITLTGLDSVCKMVVNEAPPTASPPCSPTGSLY